MANRHRGFPSRGGAKRLTQWVGPADQGFLAVAAGAKTIVASFSPGESLTVVRIRGQASIRAVATVDLDVVGAVGIGIVSDEAFAAGIVSIPGPFDSADWGGWMLWRAFSFRVEFTDATGFAFVPWYFEIDSKAMRKMAPNETLVIMAESQQGAYQVSMPTRTLIKLS